MKTPEEIKQIVTRLVGVAECLKTFGQRYRGNIPEGEFDAFNRAGLYALDAADLIDELVMANATPKPEVEFPEGSLVAKRDNEQNEAWDEAMAKRPVPQCEILLPTIHGPQRCPCNATETREWPGSPFQEAGMYGAPVLINVCEICATKEIRWTHDGKAYGVE